MKTYLTENRFKFLLGAVLFTTVFSLGAYARPGIDRFAGLFHKEPPVYVAKISDFDQAVLDYEHSTNHIARCHSQAKAQVSLEWANKFLGVSREEQERVEVLEMKAVNGISDETAKKTVQIEKSQGR